MKTVAPNGNGTPAAFASTPPVLFVVDELRRVLRVVARRDGSLSQTLVATLPDVVKSDDFSQSKLADLADKCYLIDASRRHVPPIAVAAHAKHELRVVDLFGGCGAMSLGVAEACAALGLVFRSAGAFEIDADALSVFGANFGGPEPRRNVEKILSSRVSAPISRREKRLIEELGRVDFVVAGPPCQGHSNLNNKTRRADPKNELYMRVARFAKLFSPRFIMIENVQAVLHDSGRVVERTRRLLVGLGYSVSDGVVRLSELGVAQTRRRHVLIAVRSNSSESNNGGVSLAPSVEDIVKRHRTEIRTLRWAIGDLEVGRRGGTFNSSAKPSTETRRRIAWLFDNNKYELADSERPACHRDHPHRYTAVYGRMRWGEPAPTITGGYDTMGRGRFVHPSRRRTITPHEAARIQFFPDWFDFTPATRARASLAQVIGNAVPPKLSYIFALELLR